MNDQVYHTEADGLEATWRPTHSIDRRIEIIKIHNTSDDTESDVTFAAGTDLVAARASFPKLGPLWDKISVEFWAWLSPAPHFSASTRGAVGWWN